MFPFTILFIKYLQVHMMHEHILMLYLRDRTFLKELSLCIWLWTLIYIAQFKGLVLPVQLSRLAGWSGKSVNLQRGPFLTGESPRYHPNVLHPSLRISIDSEASCTYQYIQMLLGWRKCWQPCESTGTSPQKKYSSWKREKHAFGIRSWTPEIFERALKQP